jgi:hypothetical protein
MMKDLAGILCCLGLGEKSHVLKIKDIWEGIILTKVRIKLPTINSLTNP